MKEEQQDHTIHSVRGTSIPSMLFLWKDAKDTTLHHHFRSQLNQPQHSHQHTTQVVCVLKIFV